MKKITFNRIFLKSLISNRNFRLKLSLVLGSLVNFVYILGNIFSVLFCHSIWAATLTVYHLVLALIRLYILSSRLSDAGEKEKRNLCFRIGVFMLLLDIASAFLMISSISRGFYVKYSGVILLGFSIYTGYSVTKSIVDMRRHANDKRQVHYAARNISLSASLMSLFNLQYSLLSVLGADFKLISYVVFLCGLMVFATIFGLSLRLILSGRGSLFR